jgi:hypothetical protein
LSDLKNLPHTDTARAPPGSIGKAHQPPTSIFQSLF